MEFNLLTLIETLRNAANAGYDDANVYMQLPDGSQAKIKKCILEVAETADIILIPED